MASTRSFAAGIDEFVKKTGLRVTLVMRKLALDAFTGVAVRSPVLEGRFRADWRVGVGRQVQGSGGKPRTKIKFGDPPTATELGRANREVARIKWNHTIHLTNTMLYAKPLEKGSSAQNNHQRDGILGATYEEVKANLFRSIQSVRSMS